MATALIVAAGSGERLGAEVPKALVPLGGRPMLAWSLDALAAATSVTRIIVAMPPGVSAPAGVECVTGGSARSESVRRALEAVEEGEEIVLVHDAARPLLSSALAESVIAALLADPAAQGAIAAAPVTDTIKRAASGRVVSETLPRSELWAVQTPQVFRAPALRAALEVPAEELAAATDDASLVERAGGRVILVASEPSNLKVTTPGDLQVAELLLARGRAPHA